MFSVIIPTMWKCKTFTNFLPVLENCQQVKEIILIDNSRHNNPGVKNTNKIKVFPFKHNIKVNPSWNFGVEEATCENICILNDDITFDTLKLKEINNLLKNDTGILLTNFFDTSEKLKATEIKTRGFAQACLFFIKKKNYYKIPSDLKFYYGDDWLFHTNQKRGRKNYLLKGLNIKGKISETSKSFQNIMHFELPLYWKHLHNFL